MLRVIKHRQITFDMSADKTKDWSPSRDKYSSHRTAKMTRISEIPPEHGRSLPEHQHINNHKKTNKGFLLKTREVFSERCNNKLLKN